MGGVHIPTYPLSKKYTEDTAQEMGAVKGAPAEFGTPYETTKEGKHGHIVPLKWEDKSGVEHTDESLFVADGDKGEKGDTGATGVKGDTGAKGDKGDKGDPGTPIYTWTSGATYKVNDLVIKDDKWYQCTTANSDVTFDPSKWHEIGNADGNYSILDDENFDDEHPEDYLPSGYTSQDRKMVYVVQTETFWLWNGVRWDEQLLKTITNAEIDAMWE